VGAISRVYSQKENSCQGTKRMTVTGEKGRGSGHQNQVAVNECIRDKTNLLFERARGQKNQGEKENMPRQIDQRPTGGRGKGKEKGGTKQTENSWAKRAVQ